MNRLHWVLVIALVALAGWWLLRPSPEQQVRAVHQDLLQLLRKTEADAAIPSVLDVLAYKALFAEQVRVTGDDLRGSYTAEDMARLIIRVRGYFRIIDLTFSELAITLPSPDTATATFDAMAEGSPGDGESPIHEQRRVTTELRRTDGDWVFAAFELAQ